MKYSVTLNITAVYFWNKLPGALKKTKCDV